MQSSYSRRLFMAGSASAVLVPVLTRSSPLSASQLDAGRNEWAAPDLPPVEGMSGDRRANEVWYQLEVQTRVEPSPELLNAYFAIQEYAPDLGGVDTGLLFAWLGYYGAGLYPGAYIEWLKPIKDALQFISTTQLRIFDSLYQPNSWPLVRAFEDFGQGVLYDPRHTERVHHNANVIAYTVWHSFASGMRLLGIDRKRWSGMIKLIHHARMVHEQAMPEALQLNDPLPSSVLEQIRRASLTTSLDEIDQSNFDFDYPFSLDEIPKPPGL